jgi:UDP:flavonoid glycosyltransferase YjiC (YdhE family)
MNCPILQLLELHRSRVFPDADHPSKALSNVFTEKRQDGIFAGLHMPAGRFVLAITSGREHRRFPGQWPGIGSQDGRQMRILFSATPAAGHVLPLVPLANAAGDAGHDVAFLTGPDMAGYLGSRTLVPAGPGISELMAETARRTGGDDGLRLSGASVELFVGARIDLTYDQALDQARRFAPDLLVCEALDFVGPLVAAALDVPWAAHAIVMPILADLQESAMARADDQATARGLRPRRRFALVDPLPDVLRSPADPPLPDDRVVLRPTAHAGDRVSGPVPGLPDGRPLVLVTLGTSVRVRGLPARLARSAAEAGYEVAVTVDAGTLPGTRGVHEIGFVPLARLLPGVDAVIGAGGSGTVQATLAAGLPMVLRPVLADQPWTAQRVARAGAGLVIDDPAEAGPAVRTVLTDPRYRTAAQEAAAAIQSMPAPEAALGDLLARAGLSDRA